MNDLRKWMRLVEAATETEAFLRWFGNSAVVGDDGKPLIVYHGTKGNFDIFKDQKLLAFGPGFYFAGSKTEAQKYALHGTKRNANIMPVFLRMLKPAVFWDERAYWNACGIQVFSSGRFFGEHEKKKKLTAKLQAENHDGIIIQHRLELRYAPTEYIVFAANQIKSALGNNGTFDADNDSIVK